MNTAAFLNYVVTANTAPADAALLRSQATLTKTGKTAGVMSSTMTKGFAAVGVAAGAAAVALFKVGQEFDKAYDTIQTRTGATGKSLDKLKNDFRAVVKTVPTDFDTAAAAVGGLNQRLGLTGKPLREVSRQITELSRLTGTDVEANVRNVSRAFVDWEVKTRDQTQTLDAMFALMQESGISVDDLTESVQKFGSPLRQLGFSLEEAAAMFATFEKAGVNSATMVPGFKLAISNLTRPTDELASSMEQMGIAVGKPDEALRQVFDLLGANSTLSQIEKTGLAMDVFGKRAGADMAEAIKQGRFELGDMIKVMRGADGTIRKTGKQTMDAAEAWQVFTNNLKVLVEPAATAVFEVLGKGMKDLNRMMRSEDFRSFAGDLATIFETLGEVLGPVFDLLANSMKRTIALARFLISVYARMPDKILSVFTTILDGVAKMADAMSHLPGPVGDAWDKIQTAAEDASDTLNKVREKIRGNNEKVKASFQRTATEVGQSTGKMSQRVAGNVSNMVNATVKGVGHLTSETSKALKAFGVKPLEYTPKALAKGATKTITGGILGRNRGGNVPGSGNTDSVPAMLTPGEYVVNAKATARTRPLLEAINNRYAEGGIVGLGHQLQRQGYLVGEHPAFGGVAPVHTSGSYHYSGQALDVNWSPTSQEPAKLDALYGRLKGMAGVIELLWRVADHFDHLHVAMSKGATGVMTGGIGNLARVILQGPGGPLKDMGQAALDRVRKGANAFLGKQTLEGMEPGSGGGLAKSQIAQLWSRANNFGNASLMAAIAMAESSGDPSAHGPPDGRGLWQIEWPIWGKTLGRFGNPYDAFANAQMAGEVLKQQGLGAWVVYNTGAYRQFLNKGGVVGNYAAGGDVHKGGLARVHRGERITPAGTPHVEIVLNGSMDAVLDEVDVLIDGRKAEIADYTLREGGRTRGRARQMAGR